MIINEVLCRCETNYYMASNSNSSIEYMEKGSLMSECSEAGGLQR